MAMPTDRLDDAYLERKRQEEEADLLEWAEGRRQQAAAETATRASAATTPEALPASDRTPARPGLGAEAVEAGAGTLTRGQRVLEEGGQAILRAGQRAVAGRPAQPGVAKSGLPELAEAGRAALDLAAGLGAGAGVLVGQSAIEQALVGTGLLDEAAARTGAELVAGLGIPIAATKIPAVAKALAGGSASKRVLREIIGVPEGPEAPKAPAAPRSEAPIVSVREATPEDSAKFLGQRTDTLQIEGKVLDINFDRLDTPDDVKRVLAKVSQLYREKIEKARRGVRSREETARAAEAMGLTVDDLLARRLGEAMNAEEALASRQLLVASAKRLRTLADSVQAGDEAAVQPFLKQLGLHAEIQAQAAGVRAEAGRALNIFGVDATGEVQHLSKLGQVIEDLGTGVTAERLAGMIQSLETPEQIARLAAAASKPGAAQVLTEVWINSLLSGPQTHVVNVLSNSLTTVWAIPERLVAAGFGTLTGGVKGGETTAMLFGLVEGMRDGWRLAGKAMREGMPQASKLDAPRRAIRGETFGLTGPMGRAVDYLGETVRLPTRLLMTTDEFFKGVTYRMELQAQAYRLAVAEGLEGPALAQRITAILADPPTSVKAAADDFALYQTFQRELESPVLRALGQTSNPAVKLVMPFVKTPTNIWKYVGERTPGLNLLMRSVRDDLRAGGARRDLALARVTLGGATMAGAATLAAAGYLTGGGPKDPVLRERLRETGWQPYSVKFGDRYYSFNRLDPLGALLGLAADVSEIAGELDDATADELGVALSIAVAKNLTSKTYVQGVADFFDAVSDPERYLPQFLRNYARSLVPTGIATVERTITDPTVRATRDETSEVRTLLNEVRARIPGYSDDLPPRRNLWGEPILLQGGLGPDLISPIYTSRAVDDPVSTEIVRLRIPLAMPERSLPAGVEGAPPIPLTPQEYDRYVRLAAGQGLTGVDTDLRGQLGRLMATDAYRRQTDGPEGGKALIVRAVVQAYRETARAQLVAESRELQDVVRSRVRARQEALTPGAGAAPSRRGP